MPAALSLNIREEIVNRRKDQETFRSISEEMGLSYDTVRGIWRHWEKTGKLEPNYDACRKKGVRKAKAVYEAATEMKRQHPRWGAQVILIKLRREFEQDDLPSERTLQYWFRKAGVNRTVRTQQQKKPFVKRGQEAHDVWAIDAKERIKLKDGSYASWLMITDEAKGATIYSETFPPQALEPSRTNQSSSELSESS